MQKPNGKINGPVFGISSGRLRWKLSSNVPKLHRVSKQSRASTSFTKKKIKQLKILQWNVEGYHSKKEEIANMVYEMGVDVFVIQESKLISTDETPYIPGYTIKRRDSQQRWGKE